MKMLITAILLGTLGATGTTNIDQDRDATKSRWELPADVLRAGNQISFDQKSNGVWYFMESTSLLHNPQTYQFMPHYAAACPVAVGLTGVACMWDTLDPTSSLAIYPNVTVNFNDFEVTDPYSGSRPGHSLTIHPQTTRLAVIAWRSPGDFKINISGDIRPLFPGLYCGDGVRWSVERGTQVLASGDTSVPSDFAVKVERLAVEKGEAIYLVIDPKSADNCDSTLLSVAITRHGERD